MNPLEVFLVWIVIVIIFIVVVGEIKYRYDKRTDKEIQQKTEKIGNNEDNEKIHYTLSSVFPDKQTKDECMNYINNKDDYNHT